MFEAEGTEVKRVGPVAPNLNGYAERWVQSLRTECLDHFLICGEAHLRHMLNEYLEHYNLERPHQGVGNVPLPRRRAADSQVPVGRGEVPGAARRAAPPLPPGRLTPTVTRDIPPSPATRYTALGRAGTGLAAPRGARRP